MLLTLALFATAVPQTAPIQAGGLLSARQLQQRCESRVAADASYCFAYIAGVYDAVRSYEAWLNMREFCVAKGVSQGELRQAFTDYLNDNAGYGAGEAASVVVVALKQRFACAPGKPAPALEKR